MVFIKESSFIMFCIPEKIDIFTENVSNKLNVVFQE